jgi:hypothetical protein
VIEDIGTAEGGKWGVVSFKEIFVEALHIASQGQGFSHPGIPCEEEDAAPSFDIIKSGETFFKGLGIHGLLGFDVFVKREAFESEPGQQFLHGKTLPL